MYIRLLIFRLRAAYDDGDVVPRGAGEDLDRVAHPRPHARARQHQVSRLQRRDSRLDDLRIICEDWAPLGDGRGAA